MMNAAYYRDRVATARRLAKRVAQDDVRSALAAMADDYEDLIYDLEHDAIEIRHPELMPQLKR